MKLAVMQPYLFPYIGYFQLIKAVDKFVFYDDVNYIKNGWINRNRILLNGNDHYVTVPCLKASSNKQINKINYNSNLKSYKNIRKTIYQAYKKSPYFESIYPLIDRVLSTPSDKISTLAIQSVSEVSKLLDIQTDFKISSLDFSETKGVDKADRLIAICKKENAIQYINAFGGKELYEKEYFQEQGINLNFIKPKSLKYKQFANAFIPGLSIIDVLMFNSIDETKFLLNQFELI